VVVCLTNTTFDAVDAALAPCQPVHCRDLFGRSALQSALTRAGATVVVLSGSLPADNTAVTVPVDLLVHGRNTSRAADEAIKRCADPLGSKATIAFHLSLEDAQLKPFVASILPLLEQLGLKEDEAMSHAFITRAIQNCQSL
jgi:hypothetical protein